MFCQWRLKCSPRNSEVKLQSPKHVHNDLIEHRKTPLGTLPWKTGAREKGRGEGPECPGSAQEETPQLADL